MKRFLSMAAPANQEHHSQSFPREHRLTGSAEFARVFAKPLVTRDEKFRMLRCGNGLGHCRLGLAVSRKVCRSAAGRNRIKRLVRESFRRHQQRLSGHGGWDIVVLPSPATTTICNAELARSLEHHWRQIGSQPPNPDSKSNRNDS